MAFSSTTTRGLAALALLLASLAFGPLEAAERREFKFLYIYVEDDPAYEEQRAYTGLKFREKRRPLPGAQTALRESRILGRQLGLDFLLEEVELPAEDDPAPALTQLAADNPGAVMLLDLPLAAVTAGAQALTENDAILFNIRHADMSLREEACSPVLFHTIPSLAMRSDALAQFLAARNWGEVLVLEGERQADKDYSAAFQASARKFGLDVVAVRSFVLSNDPRERDQNNIRLLTAEPDHDVIFLADSYGDFGRYVPFSTYYPRPVVGDEGLISSAWHWTFERYGAPQLNQRFDRQADRLMEDEDYAAWAAVRATVEAVVRSETTELSALRDFMTSEAFSFDLYKGAPGNFRPWNRQLRQPVLLHGHNAVVALAPVEGFLHETNNLDTLGKDERESRCAF